MSDANPLNLLDGQAVDPLCDVVDAIRPRSTGPVTRGEVSDFRRDAAPIRPAQQPAKPTSVVDSLGDAASKGLSAAKGFVSDHPYLTGGVGAAAALAGLLYLNKRRKTR